MAWAKKQKKMVQTGRDYQVHTIIPSTVVRVIIKVKVLNAK